MWPHNFSNFYMWVCHKVACDIPGLSDLGFYSFHQYGSWMDGGMSCNVVVIDINDWLVWIQNQHTTFSKAPRISPASLLILHPQKYSPRTTPTIHLRKGDYPKFLMAEYSNPSESKNQLPEIAYCWMHWVL